MWRALRSPFEPGSRAISAALLLLLCGLLLPQVNLPRNTYSYVVVFDITQSMNVEDYDLDGLPVSRLAFAREAVRRALARAALRVAVGWGAFAEYRTILLLLPSRSARTTTICSRPWIGSTAGCAGRTRARSARGCTGRCGRRRTRGGRPDVLFLTDGQEAPPEVGGPGLPLFDDLKRGEPLDGWLA